MNTTELGVYILGSTALALLGVAGVALGDSRAVVAAVISAGAAYFAQWCAALTPVVLEDDHHTIAGALSTLGIIAMLVSWLAWAFGVWRLLFGF